ncbi:MAG: adenylate cyclase [Solirubrobacteraceae bacterium]
MSEQRTSGIATVMFTDVEASTDITTHLGDDAAVSLFASHDRIVREQVAAHGGRDVRSTGDGFLVVFDSPRAAVSCALAIQRQLAEPEQAIRVRIGLNAGELLESNGELFGAAVNLAARVMDRAHGGEVLMTDTVRQLVGTMAQANFRDRGRVALKGFAERQRLYEARPAEKAPEPLPRPPQRRSRRTRAVLGAAVFAAAIAAAVAIIRDSGSANPVKVPANSLAVINPHANAVVDAIGVDENPGPVSAGAGGLWVLNLNSATLSRIDVHTRRVVETKGLGGAPSDAGAPGNLAAAREEVWVNAAGCNGSTAGALLHVFTSRGGGLDLTGADSVPVGGVVHEHPTRATTGGGCGLAANGTSAWMATNGPDGIARVDYDPEAGRSHVVWGRAIPSPVALAVGYGSVWDIDSEQHDIRRIDPKTGRTLVRIPAGADPVAITTGAGAVWVANEGDNSVSRIDPQTNRATQAIAVAGGPVAVAMGGGEVWVATGDGGSVARIDPRTNRVSATIALGHRPQGIAVAGGLVWVTVRA